MEKSATPNPLSKYFRQPSIYLKLPSGGKFWPEGTLELPITNEIPVYPMTARDEITLRTPDALINGTSVVEVVQSCCPSIKDAWQMPGVDVDAVLIAIRIASYGHEMAVDTTCPHCNGENHHTLDLRIILENIQVPDFEQRVPFDELSIKLKPQKFFGVNRQNAINFEEQRLIESLSNAELAEEVKKKMVNDSMEKLIDLGIDTVTDSTEFIELSDGTQVSDRLHIKDFFKNADGAVMRAIQNVLVEFNKLAAVKTQMVGCVECTKEYQVPLEFDYSNFFAQGS